jgi:hypothetical protein
MRTRFIVGDVEARRQTQDAFLCSLRWDDAGYAASNLWIPLSCIHDTYHDEIEEACEGDIIEIGVAEWWLKKNL